MFNSILPEKQKDFRNHLIALILHDMQIEIHLNGVQLMDEEDKQLIQDYNNKLFELGKAKNDLMIRILNAKCSN